MAQAGLLRNALPDLENFDALSCFPDAPALLSHTLFSVL